MSCLHILLIWKWRLWFTIVIHSPPYSNKQSPTCILHLPDHYSSAWSTNVLQIQNLELWTDVFVRSRTDVGTFSFATSPAVEIAWNGGDRSIKHFPPHLQKGFPQFSTPHPIIHWRMYTSMRCFTISLGCRLQFWFSSVKHVGHSPYYS